MTRSRRIARILGPTLAIIGVTEALNLELFAHNPAPVVCLNGALLLVAGVAIVQAHNRWTRDWTVMVTLTGWTLAAGGLYRMLLPAGPQATSGPMTYLLLALITAVGLLLVLQGCGHGKPSADSRP